MKRAAVHYKSTIQALYFKFPRNKVTVQSQRARAAQSALDSSIKVLGMSQKRVDTMSRLDQGTHEYATGNLARNLQLE